MGRHIRPPPVEKVATEGGGEGGQDIVHLSRLRQQTERALLHLYLVLLPP